MCNNKNVTTARVLWSHTVVHRGTQIHRVSVYVGSWEHSAVKLAHELKSYSTN